MLTLYTEGKSRFDTWKQVKVGNIGNAKTAQKMCQAADVTPTWGWEILNRMTYEVVESTLSLACVTPSDLKVLGQDVTLANVYTSAKEHGLSLCPPEVGLQLWLQHSDLPAYNPFMSVPYLLIGMEPIVTDQKRGRSKIFNLQESGGVRWLDALPSDNQGHPWPEDSRFVFLNSLADE